MTKDKFQEIIDNSGNDLQFKVADFLHSHEWEATISPYYNDPATGKPREIDIIATKKYKVRNEVFAVRLFIECKHIKDPVVFWFRQKNMKSATELAKDNSILNDKPDYYVTQDQGLAKHHYVDNVPVAKIAAKSGNRDDVFEAMNQCLNGLIFFSNGRNIPSSYHVDFPLIITDSLQNLHKRDASSGHAPITEPFQLEIDYSYKQPKSSGDSTDIMKYFLIDIVNFDALDSFLQDLENRDIKLLRENLDWDIGAQERENRHQTNEESFDLF
ncbi:MAG: hypothetical protein WC497_00345 [Patescibacteria group bacterium]